MFSPQRYLPTVSVPIAALVALALLDLFVSAQPASAQTLTGPNDPAARAHFTWISAQEDAPAAHIDQAENAPEKNDNTISCPLPAGDSTFVVALSKSSLLDRLTFVNENGAAEGDLNIAVSNYRLAANSPRWTPVDGGVHFAHKRLFNLSMLGVEAKYVRLTFHVDKPGQIAAINLPAAGTSEHFLRISNPIALENSSADFTFANVHSRTRVLFVSSGNVRLASRMIDDNVFTAFQFSSDDNQPTAVIELTADQRTHPMTVLYKRQEGHLDVFLLKNYGDAEEDPDVSGLAPAKTSTEIVGRENLAATFEPRGARYVAVRWTPEESKKVAEPFTLTEVGTSPETTLAMMDPAAGELFANETNGGGKFPPILIPELPVLAPVSQ